MHSYRDTRVPGDFSAALGGLVLIVFLALFGGFMLWFWGPELGLDTSSPQSFRTSLNERVGALVVGDRSGEGVEVAAASGMPSETAALMAVAEPTPTAVPKPAPTVAPTAPFCAAGRAPEFVLGFADLKAAVGAPMGEPIECEHTNPENGDTLQQTTTGLAIYSREQGLVMFTDGWKRWALGPSGVIHWEGESEVPPER